MPNLGRQDILYLFEYFNLYGFESRKCASRSCLEHRHLSAVLVDGHGRDESGPEARHEDEGEHHEAKVVQESES